LTSQGSGAGPSVRGPGHGPGGRQSRVGRGWPALIRGWSRS